MVRTSIVQNVKRIWVITLYKVNSEDSRDGIPSIYSMGIDLTEEKAYSCDWYCGMCRGNDSCH